MSPDSSIYIKCILLFYPADAPDASVFLSKLSASDTHDKPFGAFPLRQGYGGTR